MTKCLYCGEDLKVINGIHKEYADSLNIVIKNTPISICEHCVEEYLSAPTMYKINDILDNILNSKNAATNDIIIVDYNDYK